MPLMGEFGTRLYDFTSKIRTIVVRIGGVETVEFETSTIKDKDLARIFFFLSSSPFFPLSKDRTRCPLLPSSIYSDASWKEIQRQRTTLTKEIFILDGENRDIANNGITRAAFRFKMRRDQSIKEQTGDAFNCPPFIFLNPICSFVIELYPFIFGIHRFSMLIG